MSPVVPAERVTSTQAASLRGDQDAPVGSSPAASRRVDQVESVASLLAVGFPGDRLEPVWSAPEAWHRASQACRLLHRFLVGLEIDLGLREQGEWKAWALHPV